MVRNSADMRKRVVMGKEGVDVRGVVVVEEREE